MLATFFSELNCIFSLVEKNRKFLNNVLLSCYSNQTTYQWEWSYCSSTKYSIWKRKILSKVYWWLSSKLSWKTLKATLWIGNKKINDKQIFGTGLKLIWLIFCYFKKNQRANSWLSQWGIHSQIYEKFPVIYLILFYTGCTRFKTSSAVLNVFFVPL